MESREKISATRGIWSPKLLVVVAILFTIFPSLVMFALNYGRYGFPRKRLLWLLIGIALFVIMVVWDIVSPDWSWHRSFLLSVAMMWILYLKQIELYRQWISQGKRKASFWSGLLIGGLFVGVIVGINAVPILLEEDYGAYELILNEQYEDAERVLVESRQEFPDDLGVRYNLAVVYFSTARPDLAALELQSILKRDPDHGDAQAFLRQIKDQEDAE